ncbi:MAG: helix-turn-helix domain-containing protein [Pseudomonadota bacterium]
MSDVMELSADPVDIHVGKKIWQRRREMGLSRRALGEVIGVGLKQVNKYETAMNRVSAGRLYEIALALNVPAAWFFEGIADELGEGDPMMEAVDDMADQQEVKALLTAYHQVPADVRSRFLRLVRSIADEDGF